MTSDTSSPLVPQLRFPEFADDAAWDAKSLDDCCERLTETVGEAALTPVSISSGKGFVPQAEKFGRDISGEQYSRYIRMRRGDFAYNRGNSKRFPQGCVYPLVELDEAAASNAFYCFRLRPDCEPAFFCGLFENNAHGTQLIKFITSSARGTGLLNIRADDFFGITIPMPKSSHEQQRIADCLASLEHLIAAEDRKLDALRRHKQGLMQQLFPQEGETQPRRRFPEFHGAAEWVTRKVGSVLVKASQAATIDDNGTYREIGVRSHGNGLFHKQPTTGKAIGAKRVFHVVPGALVINIVFAWEQALAVTTPDDVGFIASHRFPMFVPIGNQCDVGFMQRLFLGPVGGELLKVASPGGAGRNRTLNQSEFENLEVIIPTVAEQERIAACLGSVDALIASEARRLDGLWAHKRGLLQQLFPAPAKEPR